ncbi:MAG TPA: FAD-dependent oxidoreductase [Actinomycetota bacterium]|jgi:sulfide:quinone oxidoreductase|nr:FAD-dependent oxidoreductase [Actinomycetota bacterium]
MTARPRIVVAGGGFAGLEAAFMARMRLHDNVDITVVSDHERFLFKPNTTYIPFGAEPDHLFIDLDKPLKRRNIAFIKGQVVDVDPGAQTLVLADRTRVPYDFLVLATGASMRPEEIPGLTEHAAQIFTVDAMLDLRRRLDKVLIRAEAGRRSDVLFVVPPNNKCSGPLYEIVFMLETWLRRHGVRDQVNITYSTYERSFIQAFGPRLHQVVASEFAERGIEGHTEEVVERIRAGEARFEGGVTRSFDDLISFPPYVAAVHYPALPSDERGFITTDLPSREVVGYPGVYAPGDAGDFPVKQAFLAFLEADSTAEHVAARVQDRQPAGGFDPVSMCVMEMFDKATFAQVPLRLTGDPLRPVEVRPDADGEYKVGVSPLWRLGKKLLGVYLPMRFRAGEPFHAGVGWTLMDVGLKGMTGVLTT